MLVYILVLGCACALAEGKKAAPPAYMEAMTVMLKAIEVLEKNVLSMESGVPLMDDPRRHYVEMVSAVCQQADNLYSCMEKDYDMEYPLVLNKTVGMGIMEPRMVMDGVADIVETAMAMTDKIRPLIENQCKDVRAKDCNVVVDEEVNMDQVRYKSQVETLMAVGKAASEFMEMEATFGLAAKRHAAVKYAVEGKAPLKPLIMATVDMKKTLKPILC